MAITSRCPACESDNTKLYLEGDDSINPASIGSSRTKLSHGRILRCIDCGTGFRSFRPDPQQLAEMYRGADDEVYEAELPNRLKTAKRHRDIVERHHSEPGSIVDIGCASGTFLRQMADHGWTVYGVEPAASQYARAKLAFPEEGRIQQTVLEEAVLPDDVDAVTIWDVLEHVPEPEKFLQRCSSLLRQGGLLALNVPRMDSFAARVLHARWPLMLAEHLNYFTADGLRELGKRAGLKLISTGSRPATFSMDYICYRLSQHGVPGMQSTRKLLTGIGMQEWSLAVWMGEIFAVFSKS